MPSRGTILVLGFIAIFHFQFSKLPSSLSLTSNSLLGEIPSMESNFEMIHTVATDITSTMGRGLLNNNNYDNTDNNNNNNDDDVNNKNNNAVASSSSSTADPPQTQPPKPEPTPPPTIQETKQPKRAKKSKRSAVVELPPQRQNEHKKVVTVIAQLNGELGNQMHKIANAICVQRHIEGKLKLPTELKLRAQESPKWEHSMKWMKEAFPKTRPLDFRAGNTVLFDQVRQIQQEWIQYLVNTKQVNLKGIGNPKIMNHMKSSGWQPTMEVLRLLNQTWYLERPSAPGGSTEFSIPHVYSDTFTSRYCFEKMLPQIRDFFQIDEYQICKQKPQPEESVLHLRNFLTEMGDDVGQELGFEELDPNKTATEIFKDYPPGSKVAIVSRYPDHTDEYIKALKEIRGIEARYIPGQTGNQDFCFLLKSRQEIIGQRISTFATWAGLLGKPKKLRLYSVDSKYTRAKKKSFYNATWKHPELKQLIVYENYKA